MSRSDNPYVYETGENFLSSYAVTNGRELYCQLGRVVFGAIDAGPGDTVGIHPHPHGALVTAPPSDRATIAERELARNGQLTLNAGVLREHVGAGDGDRVRVYKHPDGLVLVADSDDPRVGGDGA